MVYLPCFDSKLVRLEIETALARLMMPQLLAISFDSRLVRLKAQGDDPNLCWSNEKVLIPDWFD